MDNWLTGTSGLRRMTKEKKKNTNSTWRGWEGSCWINLIRGRRDEAWRVIQRVSWMQQKKRRERKSNGNSVRWKVTLYTRVKSNRMAKKYWIQHTHTSWPFVRGKSARQVFVPFSITPMDELFDRKHTSQIVLTGCVWLSVFFISEWSHFQQIKRRCWFCSITCTRRRGRREKNITVERRMYKMCGKKKRRNCVSDRGKEIERERERESIERNQSALSVGSLFDQM